LAATLTPCQGLPNFIVYWYPKYAKARRKNPSAGRLVWIRKALAAFFNIEAPRQNTRTRREVSPLPAETEERPGVTTLFHAAMMRQDPECARNDEVEDDLDSDLLEDDEDISSGKATTFCHAARTRENMRGV
jgi:hypothetical protein